MKSLEERNQQIIDAIIEKANSVCPGSLALIGIYGSFMTGDYYEKSDLDLLILINDDRGWQLGCTFIQDDLQVGHDIYCTTWESLQNDALYQHPNISKLMDSRIIYCADEKYLERLETLREEARGRLDSPFSREDYENAEKMLKEAEHAYVMALTAETISSLRVQAGNTIYYIENAIAMLNKKYFRYGTKRAYEELEAMAIRPAKLCELIESIVTADSAESLRQQLTELIRATTQVFQKAEKALTAPKPPATADSLRGTYEEMYSNWRNKMYLAADRQDRHLAFLCMNSLDAMLADIGSEAAIDSYDVLCGYDPQDLQSTAKAYDNVLEKYLSEYERAGLEPKHYSDIETFIKNYIKV